MHKQNYSVNQLELYVVHVLFLFFLIDYKHKHTATGLGCYGAHALNPIFLIK